MSAAAFARRSWCSGSSAAKTVDRPDVVGRDHAATLASSSRSREARKASGVLEPGKWPQSAMVSTPTGTSNATPATRRIYSGCVRVRTARARDRTCRRARHALPARARPEDRAADAGLDDLLTRQNQPAGVDVKPLAEVGECVAGDDRSVALDPDDHVVRLLPRVRLDAGRQGIPFRIHVRLALPLFQQPDHIRAAVPGLLGGDAVRIHEVLRAIRPGCTPALRTPRRASPRRARATAR